MLSVCISTAVLPVHITAPTVFVVSFPLSIDTVMTAKHRQTAAKTVTATPPPPKQQALVDKTAAASATPKSPPSPFARQKLAEEHLPPLPLVLTVLLCSGLLAILSFRDFAATGRNVLGDWDEQWLLFTKSTDWYDDSKGWKSTQGGFSTVATVTTDANNMGGLFVRKMSGAAGLGAHVNVLWPFLFHPVDAQWQLGHFAPLLWTMVVTDLMLATFYAAYWHDLIASQAAAFATVVISVLLLESLVIITFLLRATYKKGIAVAMPEGKTPRSTASNIVTRTVTLVSGAMALIAARDLFFPGTILDFVPRDDIYLEWTNVFVHSPAAGSPEAVEQGLEAPLYVGDKFVAQLMALYILINCVYKFVAALGVRFGNDGGGVTKAKMMWQGQFVADASMLFVLRLFTPAAASASLDLRWHLMCVAYEAFILALHAFF